MSTYNDLPLSSLTDFLEEYTYVSGGSITGIEGLFTCYRNPSELYSRYILSCSDENALSEAISFIKNDQNKTPVYITYDVAVMPEGINIKFEKSGFKPYIIQRGMVLDLSDSLDSSDIPDSSDILVTSDIHVLSSIEEKKDDANVRYNDPHVRYADTEDVKSFSKTLFKGFEGEKPYEPFIYDTLINDPRLSFYIYEDEGMILGTAILFKDISNAGIHDVAVLPEHRGKGISRTILLKAIDDMKKVGGNHMSLQASPGGAKVYASLGFKNTSLIYSWSRV